MQYYNNENRKEIGERNDATLQRYFPGNNFGVSNAWCNEDGKVEHITIDKCSGNPIGIVLWTHYANIEYLYNKGWEVNTQFNGENKDEMWIYKYFSRFADAVRFVASGKIEKSHPIEIYK